MTSAVVEKRIGVSPAMVGLLAFVFAGLAVAWVLSQVGWDASIFVGFGGEAEPTRLYAEERLGEVFLRTGQGHDGKFFFVQGNDPWVLEPEVNAVVLDRPLYRSQRMFYPLLAGGFGLFSPDGVVWGLLLVNVIALGLGTWAVAVLAKEMGLSAWWGLAFLLNIGLVSELNIDGAGIVAAAAAFGAVALFLKDRFWWGVGLLVVAALSREVMLLVAAGSAWWWWRVRHDRTRALWTVLVPGAAVALWALYLRLQIGWDAAAGEIQEIGLPFVGFIQALTNYWIHDPIENLVVGFGLLILFFVFAARALASNELVGWAFVLFGVLGVVFTQQVWRNYFDIARAVAPVITAFVILVFATRADRARANRVGRADRDPGKQTHSAS
jgi:hypothetical protein